MVSRSQELQKNISQRGSTRLRRLWIISPAGLSCAAFALFLVAWLFPPSAYSEYLQERNLIYLDPTSMLFVLVCLGGFWLGAWSIPTFFSTDGLEVAGRSARTPMNVAVPLMLAIAANAIVLNITLAREPLLFPLLLMRQGDALKEAAARAGTLFATTTALTGLLWWALWRKTEVATGRRTNLFLRIVIGLDFLSALVNCVLTVDRTSLLPLIIGTLALKSVIRAKGGSLGSTSISWSILKVLSLVIGLFFLVSFLRGTDDLQDFVAQLIAYSIAAYNRLAAELGGALRYPYGGSGVYLSPFISYSATLQRIVPAGESFGWPSFYEVWSSEFAAMSRAGLNRDAIWSGSFGYLFSDLGWFAPAYFAGYGVLVSAIWRSLQRGRLFGILLYPWCAFCILFWHGTNLLLDVKFVLLLGVCACMTLYEKVTDSSKTRLPEPIT